jgi:CRP-like cAMP-binding protein
VLEPLDAMESLAVITRCRRGQEIGRRRDHFYRIVSGAARKCALMADGRRQVLDFLLPGDFFGFARSSEHHFFVIEAMIEGTAVARYSRRCLERLAATDPQVAARIREIAFETISRLERRILALGRMTALEVGSFLLEMADRSSGKTEEAVLPMSRYDIADYLALAVETVSRALTDLKHCGAITIVDIHRVKILDRRALEENDRNGGQEQRDFVTRLRGRVAQG